MEHKDKMKELADLIDYKIENEVLENQEFFTMIKEQYEEQELKQKEGLDIVEKIVGRKLIGPYFTAFKAISSDDD